MKRILCLILTLALMLALTGCGELVKKIPGWFEELEDLPGLEGLFPTAPDSAMPNTDNCFPQDPHATAPGWDSLISGLPGSILPGMEDPSATQATTQPAAGLWPGEEDVIITEPAVHDNLLPLDSGRVDLVFSSGAGNWGTLMSLYPDGSFGGEFFDMDMGDGGENYPNGTMWCCYFQGRFENFVQINENTWSLKLDYLEMEREEGETWIQDGIRYIATTPYGLEDSEEFWLFLPDAPVSVLPEDAIPWWPYFFYAKEDRPDTISCYGLMNMESNYTFFSRNDG